MITSADGNDTVREFVRRRAEKFVERAANLERSRLLEQLQLYVDICSEPFTECLAPFESRPFYIWSDTLACVFDRSYVHFSKNIPLNVRYCLLCARYRRLHFFTSPECLRLLNGTVIATDTVITTAFCGSNNGSEVMRKNLIILKIVSVLAIAMIFAGSSFAQGKGRGGGGG